jgi:hypothetical protein
MSFNAEGIKSHVESMAATLEVSTDEIVIVAGGVFALHGIRPAHDIDASVDSELLDTARAKLDTIEQRGACNNTVHATGVWEFGDGWGGWRHADILGMTSVTAGVRHIDLAYVAYWKSQQAREKDKNDLWLLAKYISRLTSSYNPIARQRMEPTLRLLAEGTPELSPPINAL